MTKKITIATILPFKQRLENHPIYEAVKTIEDLKCFMEHHVYSVWDFMSLVKYVQSIVAPTLYPWVPKGNANVMRFINELVLEEETDVTRNDGEFSSHFELYQRAMSEIGANVDQSTDFVRAVSDQGIEQALNLPDIPEPSRIFMSQTFEFISSNEPHQVASAFALGREHIIPSMFRSILNRTGVSESEAPLFHYYINRHIRLDEDHHAPLSLRLLDELCAGDEAKLEEALDTAEIAVRARSRFWDGVLDAINSPADRQQ